MQTTPMTTQNLDKPKKGNPRVNKELALSMALQGKTYEQIAERFGVSKQAISLHLKGYTDTIQAYQAFKEDPATMYEYKEWMIANSLSREDVKKMSGYQKVGAMALIRDKVRLERGKATQITQSIQYILSQIELEDKTGGKTPPKKAAEVGDVIDVTPHDDDSTEHE